MFKKIAFTMYSVIDMVRARHFYEETLGLKVSQISAEDKWVEYDLLFLSHSENHLQTK